MGEQRKRGKEGREKDILPCNKMESEYIARLPPPLPPGYEPTNPQ